MIYGGLFDPLNKKKRQEQLEEMVNHEGFWSSNNTNEIIKELNSIRKILDPLSNLKKRVEDNISIINELKKQNDDDIKDILELEIKEINKELEELEINTLLNEPYDNYNAILEIHAGAGGTEACDWALMLFRMYLRYLDKEDYKYEILEQQDYEEAGIKSATIAVKGDFAYGCLKNEKGVHRLVRLSPFDSNNRRHTSFASVEVTPLFENEDTNIEIKEEDLKIDVYRSSGAGGQHVNTTDSAVRITHLPTKMVVTCQAERSQIKNREKALMMLKSKLYQYELLKKEEELKKIKGESININFGSQIRSYIMHPYSLVKDHRTNFENVNVDKVLDGDIKEFINQNLKRG